VREGDAMEKTIVDAVSWTVLTAVAVLGGASNQDWATGHGRIVGAAVALAAIGAALKTFPVFTKAKAVSVAAAVTQEHTA
jgi:hypothetical protein